MARADAFWPTAVVGEADNVNFVSASACHIGGPKGVSPGQKALLHGTTHPVIIGTEVQCSFLRILLIFFALHLRYRWAFYNRSNGMQGAELRQRLLHLKQ